MIKIEEIRKAHNRIMPYIHRTPVLTNKSLNELCGAELYFKCENFQKAGSFKIRGATNAVMLLSDKELGKGIVTASSGNHGAALAMAATSKSVSVQVVMPKNTPKIKVKNVMRNSGEIIWCEPNVESREKVLSTDDCDFVIGVQSLRGNCWIIPVEILEIESLISRVLFLILKIGSALPDGIELLKIYLHILND